MLNKSFFVIIVFVLYISTAGASSMYHGFFDEQILNSDEWKNSAISEELIDHESNQKLIKNSVLLHFFTK